MPTTIPNTTKTSSPDQIARNRFIAENGTTTPVGAPIAIQISTNAPSNMPPTGYLSMWATSAGLQTSIDGGTTVAGGQFVISRQLLAGAVDETVFIADRAYRLTAVRCVNTVAGTGGAASVDIKKCTGTQAPASGVTMLLAVFDLTTTAHTVTNPALTATGANLLLAAGDRIAQDVTGTLTSLVSDFTLVLVPA